MMEEPSVIGGAWATPASGQVYGIIDPDYARYFTIIRTLAWQQGYAIGMHGSFTRDLDLIAVPWTEQAGKAEHLVARIVDATDLKNQDGDNPPRDKPHGRRAWSLLLPGFTEPRWIDLSIMPVQPAQPLVDPVVADPSNTSVHSVERSGGLPDAASGASQ